MDVRRDSQCEVRTMTEAQLVPSPRRGNGVSWVSGWVLAAHYTRALITGMLSPPAPYLALREGQGPFSSPWERKGNVTSAAPIWSTRVTLSIGLRARRAGLGSWR